MSHKYIRDTDSLAAPAIYPAGLQPLFQSLLSTLANMDLEYQGEREKLSKDAGNANLQRYLLQKLTARHNEWREPYVRQLAVLQERVRTMLS